jgi:hypothetical protein
MEIYVDMTKKKATEEKEDPISAEELDTSHPRAVMMLRRSNHVPYPYNTESLYALLTKGDGTDPFTRIPFHDLTRQRIIMYKESLRLFPNYVLDVKNLYERWVRNKDDQKVSLEAKVFLQAEDLVGIFQTFSGKGSMQNREEAEKFLQDTGRTWVLRSSSLIDTEYNKGYTLTQKYMDTYSHAPIVHLIGKGFYYRVDINRGETIQNTFTYVAEYPTIIDLLTARIRQR